MNKVNKRFITLAIGIVLLTVALLMSKFGLLRAILCILSIIILTYSNQLERTNKKVFIPLFIIIFTLFVVALDYLVVGAFKKPPIFTYTIVSSNNGTVYNALGYRVWSCKDNTFKVDPLYKLGYYCDKESMSAENINNVLSTIVNNFNYYEGSYVKVIGRVSGKLNDNSFYMQMFKEEDNTIRFDDTMRLIVQFDYNNKDFASLSVNSIVTVLGKIERNENNNIYMIDSSFTKESVSSGDVIFGAETNIYCEYDKQLWFQTSDNLFYKSCIEDVNLKINDNVYNLQNAIQNNLITLEEIKDDATGYQTQSKDGSRIYKYKDFNMLVCDPTISRDIIIGRLEMDFSDGYCNTTKK